MPTEADSEKGGAVDGWLILMGKSGKWVGGDQDAFMSDSDHKQATKSPKPWEAGDWRRLPWIIARGIGRFFGITLGC